MSIKAIIFDLGNVVFPFSNEPIFAYFAGLTHRSIRELKADCRPGEMFHRFERGEISALLFRKYLSKLLRFDLSEEQFMAGWNSIFGEPEEGMNALLEQLKHRYRLVALSNTNIIHAGVWEMKYKDILTHFEKVFSSFRIGARKPEAAAFKIVLDFLEVAPREVVFFDDDAVNTARALEMGIASVTVTSFLQMKK
ncbi:MAG: HAD family phosphatase, partial [bacterium]|nr:HAD family phosphatase [bacterium]